MSQPEAEDEVVDSHARVFRAVSASGMRLIDILSRAHADRDRRAAEGQREAAAALEHRERAQQKAMHTIVGRSLNPGFEEKASDRDLAVAFVWAEAYAQRDPLAGEAHDRLAQQIERRHSDVAEFVDSHVRSEDLERVPAPDGQLSGTVQRAQDHLTAQEQEMVAATQAQAEAWANIIDVQGEAPARKWLQEEQSQDAETMRHRERWAHLSQSEVEQTEGDENRAQGADPNEPDREEHREHSKVDEAEERIEDSLAEQERKGLGRFPNTPRDIEQVEEMSPAAAEALRTSAPGRLEPARVQVQGGRHRADRKPPKARRAGADRDHDRSR